MAKLRKDEVGQGRAFYVFYCPGCGNCHSFEVPRWTFSGSMDKPTFTPSLLCNQSDPASRCHLFVTDGKIKYQPDCHHKFAGQTVDMVELEDLADGR